MIFALSSEVLAQILFPVLLKEGGERIAAEAYRLMGGDYYGPEEERLEELARQYGLT